MPGIDDLDGLYEQIVLDHYRNPRSASLIKDATVDVEVNNPFCGDEIRLQVAITAVGKVSAISVSGRGCAISQSSGSLMARLIESRNAEELRALAGLARRLLTGKEVTEAELDSVGDLAALAGVRKFPVRVKCALLAWSALEEAAEKLAAAKSG